MFRYRVNNFVFSRGKCGCESSRCEGRWGVEGEGRGGRPAGGQAEKRCGESEREKWAITILVCSPLGFDRVGQTTKRVCRRWVDVSAEWSHQRGNGDRERKMHSLDTSYRVAIPKSYLSQVYPDRDPAQPTMQESRKGLIVGQRQVLVGGCSGLLSRSSLPSCLLEDRCGSCLKLRNLWLLLKQREPFVSVVALSRSLPPSVTF
ncbi:hypothetical protein E2C01_064851 [Portunus trituberculatus]|uniref:Uncharacterized protein n=1 Tax=Portunus trituberculatus TaxID=210409 RepID=A0A5B7HN05_PORTR|nr:hypothetical protein [Portunus trituberculatus]